LKVFLKENKVNFLKETFVTKLRDIVEKKFKEFVQQKLKEIVQKKIEYNVCSTAKHKLLTYISVENISVLFKLFINFCFIYLHIVYFC